MTSHVLEELDGIVGCPITRPAERVQTAAVRAACDWISLAIVAGGSCALTLQLFNHSVPSASGSSEATTSLPASLYSDHPAIDADDREAIAAIARAVRDNPTPVVVAGYANRSGERDQNLLLVQKRAISVRKALVRAGVPPMQIVVVSPTLTEAGDSRRVEVALVQGVRAFPTQPAASGH
jgi:hypothetical protein